MTSLPMAQTQVVADQAKEYGMNKLMPFTGNQTKIRQFFQDCLGYLDMNQNIYNTDRRKIHWSEFCPKPENRNKGIKIPYWGFQCGWNLKQMRNHNKIHLAGLDD
jgi:hypothetical protein